MWTAKIERYRQELYDKISVFIESNDFKHDVRLYVDGDFLDYDQQYEYAKKLAERLNKCEKLIAEN